jgi:CRP-like cAMP-binding protein
MPDQRGTADFLATVPLFKSLKRNQLETLAKQASVQTFETDQEIVTQGKPGVGLFILMSGEAQVVHMQPDGTCTVVNLLGPTDFFGELALLTEGPRTASVVATAPTQCVVLTHWSFFAVLRNDADMAIAILEELAWRFSVALQVI